MNTFLIPLLVWEEIRFLMNLLDRLISHEKKKLLIEI